MGQPALIEEWWTEPGQGDQAMEDEHGEFWQKIVEQVIDINIKDKKILDFGCNQGGLLRKFYDEQGFKEAVGIDLAQKSIAVANSRKGDRPIAYEALTNLNKFENEFDIAISTAVIYLIEDIESHARQIFRALKSGGIYYATHPDYTSDPAGKELRTAIDEYGSLKSQPHTLDDYAEAFAKAGFRMSIKRLQPTGYIGISKPSVWYSKVVDAVNAEYVHSYSFKLIKP